MQPAWCEPDAATAAGRPPNDDLSAPCALSPWVF